MSFSHCNATSQTIEKVIVFVSRSTPSRTVVRSDSRGESYVWNASEHFGEDSRRSADPWSLTQSEQQCISEMRDRRCDSDHRIRQEVHESKSFSSVQALTANVLWVAWVDDRWSLKLFLNTRSFSLKWSRNRSEKILPSGRASKQEP
jgi:hypothetical protein